MGVGEGRKMCLGMELKIVVAVALMWCKKAGFGHENTNMGSVLLWYVWSKMVGLVGGWWGGVGCLLVCWMMKKDCLVGCSTEAGIVG